MYQEKTEPIIEHYRKQNVLHEINSNCEFDEVFKQIDEIIKRLNFNKDKQGDINWYRAGNCSKVYFEIN